MELGGQAALQARVPLSQQDSGLFYSFLPLQVLLYIHTRYSAAFALIHIALLIYKAEELVFPEHALGGEVFAWVVFVVVEGVRLAVGDGGNRAADSNGLMMFLGASVVVAALHVYWLWWQVWVFHLDWVLSWLALALLFLEFVMAGKVVAQLGSGAAARRRR